jgi:hypothetical protein
MGQGVTTVCLCIKGEDCVWKIPPLLPVYDNMMGALLLHITGVYNLSDKAGADFSSSKGRFTHSMPCPCRSPAMPCR